MTQPTAVRPTAEPARNTRLFVLVGVGVAVLLLAFVLPKLLFGGDDGGDELAVPATVVPDVPATIPSTPPPAVPPPETIQVFTNKNPFTPLVNMASGAGATVVAVPVQTDPAAPSTVPPATSPTPGGTATGPGAIQRVSVIDISSDAAGETRATVQVNDTLYEVSEGEEFAGSYRVVSLSESEGCAQLLYGDDRFRVCEGEELLK